MNVILDNCQGVLDTLAQAKQARIEQLIEEVTADKYEKVAELKASFDFMIKRLDSQKQKDKADAKRLQRDEEVRQLQEQMEAAKRERLEAVNREYEERKR